MVGWGDDLVEGVGDGSRPETPDPAGSAEPGAAAAAEATVEAGSVWDEVTCDPAGEGVAGAPPRGPADGGVEEGDAVPGDDISQTGVTEVADQEIRDGWAEQSAMSSAWHSENMLLNAQANMDL